jgi:hypothetical protein
MSNDAKALLLILTISAIIIAILSIPAAAVKYLFWG